MGVITRGIANNILSGGTIDATDGLSGTVSASNITDSSISSVTAFPAAAGDFIQSTASDPSPATLGDVWYNNATYAFKVASVTTVGTWASGGNLNTPRSNSPGSGTQTAAIAQGGYSIPTGNLGATELYNGTSWTSNPTGLNTARSQAASSTGSQTSSVLFGGGAGSAGTTTEIWNGSTWTSNPTGLNTARHQHAGCGASSTSAIAISGRVPGPSSTTATETWNGTSWTTSPATVNAGRWSAASSGTQTAALFFGGVAGGPALSATESYNGTSWTTVSSIGTARYDHGGCGTQTLALAFSGSIPPQTGATELWNGTSWTSNPNGVATTRVVMGSAGTQTAGLAFGGTTAPGPQTASTEEFTGPGSPTTKTITTS